jgi:hypothetical protein
VNIDECESNPCHNGASCLDGIADYTCLCQAGFTGRDCKVNIDECEVSSYSSCASYHGEQKVRKRKGTFSIKNFQLGQLGPKHIAVPTKLFISFRMTTLQASQTNGSKDITFSSNHAKMETWGLKDAVVTNLTKTTFCLSGRYK